jgi:hypothetical protein
MAIRTHCRRFAIVFLATASAGCVVLPMKLYVADAEAGVPVYESCSLTPELPIGVKVERPGLQAIVSIVSLQGGLVRVQFDVPAGTTVTLYESKIRIDARDGTAPRLAPIANVNPAAPARYPETPAIQKLVLPVDAPMRGGRLRPGTLSSDTHYWVAAPFADPAASDVWITLPALSIDGRPTQFDEIHFARRLVVGHAFFNC